VIPLSGAHCISITANRKRSTVKLFFNNHSWYPKKAAIVQRWSLFRGFSVKIDINIDLAGFMLAIFEGWSLFRVGRQHRFDCTFEFAYWDHG
jgi:hypothetical protein